jgi:hypothetical protein
VTGKGVIIGEPLRGYWGLTSGIPGPWSSMSAERVPDLGPRKVPSEPRGGPHE